MDLGVRGEHAPTARFADGTVSGWTGCNRFTASYEADGDSLEIGTRRDDPDGLRAGGRGGSSASTWRRWSASRGARAEGDELVLEDGEGNELLRFRAASPVGEWVATMFLQRDAVSSTLLGTEVTATFGADGTLTGSAGCNTYRATYDDRRRHDQDLRAGHDQEGLHHAGRRSWSRSRRTCPRCRPRRSTPSRDRRCRS